MMAKSPLLSVVSSPPRQSLTSLITRQYKALKSTIPELLALHQLLTNHPSLIHYQIEQIIECRGLQLPLLSLRLGDLSTANSCLLITAGVHGVERVGSQLLLSWLGTLLNRLNWDTALRQQFSRDIALIIVPIVNPGGMADNKRSNPDGIDLNRHAPIDAEDRVPWPVGGQRISRHLPWYRGAIGAAPAAEFVALENIIRRCRANNRTLLTLDIHSGFGLNDHLWIPHAYKKAAIDSIASYAALKLLLDKTYPYHCYRVGPQACHYLSHGDLWDYFYCDSQRQGLHIMPLTLELGSWRWVKKRPRQLLRFASWFHPVTPHRHGRVMRRHLLLLDFLLAATKNFSVWNPTGYSVEQMKQLSDQLWFQG